MLDRKLKLQDIEVVLVCLEEEFKYNNRSNNNNHNNNNHNNNHNKDSHPTNLIIYYLHHK